MKIKQKRRNKMCNGNHNGIYDNNNNNNNNNKNQFDLRLSNVKSDTHI